MGRHARSGPNRREFIIGGAGVGAGLALAFAGRLDFLFGGSDAEAAMQAARAAGGGGTTPAANAAGLMADPAGRLSLPPGFRYTIVAQAGVTDMEGGAKTPAFADGQAAFAAPGGGTVLVTNHEIAPGDTAVAVPAEPTLTFDPGCPGGTTTVVLDPAGNRVSEYVSLAGTDHNCAGGVTPWGTWLSCEESEASAGDSGRQRDHGYVFEVDPLDRLANLHPAPIKALGRFRHEAVVVDPGRGHLYLTEDAVAPNGLLYRYVPPDGVVLARGVLRQLGPADGVLAGMKAFGPGGLVRDLSEADEPGTTYTIEWTPVEDRDARTMKVRKQFWLREEAVTRSRKLEGAWWADDGVYFVSSYAKPQADYSPRAHGGQVWFLNPAEQTITLLLWYAPRETSTGVADGPDNITVSPYGGVLIAEDGTGGQHLLGASPLGDTFYVARNEVRLPSGRYSEFTGPVFSPDKRTLFANLQNPGTTFAITGPWETLAAEKQWKSR